MSRLDRHVGMVRNKLALGRFLDALAWASLVLVAMIWLAVIVDRVLRVNLPRQGWWLIGGAGAAVLFAFIYAMWRRPSEKEAAVAIDERLALKEKFSTALFVRSMSDPFAKAAVLDAERTADNVSLQKRFPLSFPRAAYSTIVVAFLAFLTAMFLKPMDLFGREEQQKQIAEIEQKKTEAKKVVEQALAIVNSQPQGVADNEAIQKAKKDLEAMRNSPVRDPEQTRRSAQLALQEMSAALKQEIAKNNKYAEAKNDEKMLKQLQPASDEQGPVADAQRDISKGQFEEAVADLEKAVDKFDKMDEKEKDKAVQQMKQMANQLQQMAKDPKVQEQIQKQLQQMGMNQQQAQQMAQQMQQAAQGDKQAQQQLQQQAQKAMQQVQQQAQAGNKQAQQQLQQMQQMMQQMQAQANSQQQANQMGQAAQQMAQAMQQAAAQAKQGGQQGQGKNAQQQMQQGQAAMKQQLQQMQAMANDAKALDAAQQNAQQGAQAAGNQGQGAGQQGQDGNAQGQAQGKQGQFGGNNGGKNPGQGPNGGGIGVGDRTFKEEAPYDVKKEVSPSQDLENGKTLASTLIKAPAEKGTSKLSPSAVVESTDKDSTDEVDQERISKQAAKSVRDYFSSVKQDVGNAPAESK